MTGMKNLNRIDVMIGRHAETLGGTILLRLREWPAPAGPPSRILTRFRRFLGK